MDFRLFRIIGGIIEKKDNHYFLKNRFIKEVSEQFKVLVKKNLKIPIQFYKL